MENLKTGDKVTTGFYRQDKHLVRTVIRIYDPGSPCQSGLLVSTVDEFGRKLDADLEWFKKVTE